MNWVMSAAVAPLVCRAPFAFRVVGKTDSTNLRMHWHRGELIFNWECSVRRAARPRSCHGTNSTASRTRASSRPATGTRSCGRSGWIACASSVDGEVRFEGPGRLFRNRIRAPSVGPCFGSARLRTRVQHHSWASVGVGGELASANGRRRNKFIEPASTAERRQGRRTPAPDVAHPDSPPLRPYRPFPDRRHSMADLGYRV